MSTEPGTRPNPETAKRLRAARTLTGLNQQDFADRIGVSRSIVSQYETASNIGHYKPPFLLAWSYYSGVVLDWVITGEGPMTPSGVSPLPSTPDTPVDPYRPLWVGVERRTLAGPLLGATIAGRALAMA